MNKLFGQIKPVWLACMSGLLLVLAWPPLPTAFLLFVAFVPLLQAESRLREAGKGAFKFWLHCLLALFIWNLGTTWWVWFASPGGSVAMLIFNTVLMSLPLLLFSITKKVLPQTGYWSFPIYWVGFEYFHFNWDASWPWLTLGKGLSSFPCLIQWYEYTGELGGSVWILALNIAVLLCWRLYKTLTVLMVPVLVSVALLFVNFQIYKGGGIYTVIVQPNIDPYTEKFENDIEPKSYISAEEQSEIMAEMVKKQGKSMLVVCPETAITGMEDEQALPFGAKYTLLKSLVDSGYCKGVLAGAETYSLFHSEKRPTFTARNIEGDKLGWYDSYNTALMIEAGEKPQVYHKSKLVPGTEKMPFAQLGIFESMSISLGGTSGSLGVSDSAINFTLDSQYKIAPVICYESIFGDYVAEYVRKGAQCIAIITNDGWWHNTPGYKQHLYYGAIRAIETRRWVARSANTGISCFISPQGEIIKPLGWDKRGCISYTMHPSSKLTFYVRHGNITAGVACGLSIILLLLTIVFAIFKPEKKEYAA